MSAEGWAARALVAGLELAGSLGALALGAFAWAWLRDGFPPVRCRHCRAPMRGCPIEQSARPQTRKRASSSVCGDAGM